MILFPWEGAQSQPDHGRMSKCQLMRHYTADWIRVSDLDETFTGLWYLRVLDDFHSVTVAGDLEPVKLRERCRWSDLGETTPSDTAQD